MVGEIPISHGVPSPGAFGGILTYGIVKMDGVAG